MPLNDVEHAKRVARFFGEGMVQEGIFSLLLIRSTELYDDLRKPFDFLVHLEQAEVCLRAWLKWQLKAQRREHAA